MATDPHGYVPLSVNLSTQTADGFRELISRKGLRIAEGVRRAIAVWKFAEDEVAAGSQLAVIRPDGSVVPLRLMP